jgi:hypothetical protein
MGQIVPVGQFGNKADPRQFRPRFVERKAFLLGFAQEDEEILHAFRQQREVLRETGGRVAAATTCAAARGVGAYVPHLEKIAPIPLHCFVFLFSGL